MRQTRFGEQAYSQEDANAIDMKDKTIYIKFVKCG